MALLRPLPPVLAQYRSDARRIAELRGEVRNLSQVLAALRSDVGAYGYEELRQRVLLLEGRLQRCMQKLGRGLWGLWGGFGSLWVSMGSQWGFYGALWGDRKSTRLNSSHPP